MRRTALVIVLVLLVAPGALASARPETARGASTEAERVIRVPMALEPIVLNPFAAWDEPSSRILGLVYDTTVKRNESSGLPQPWVALEWCRESRRAPGLCSLGAGDDDLLNITVLYQVGALARLHGGPVLWHDGRQVDVDDILFSYLLVANNGRWFASVKDLVWTASDGYDWSNPPYRDAGFQRITVGGPGGERGWLGVKKADDHSLQFRLRRPYADFFQDTLAIALYPKHVWSPHIDTTTGEGDYYSWDLDHDETAGAAPGLVGSGPFRFAWWKKGTGARVERFDAFFDWTVLPAVDETGRIKRPGERCTVDDPRACAYSPEWTAWRPRPRVDAVEFVFVAGGWDAFRRLQEGSAWGPIPVTPAEVSRDGIGEQCLDRDGERVGCGQVLGFLKVSGRSFHHLMYNLRRQPFGYADFPNGDLTDTGRPLRQAMARLIPKGTLVSEVLQGFAHPGIVPVSPDLHPWYNDSLAPYLFDPAEAGRILDAAGWGRDPSCPKIGNPADFARKLPVIGCRQVDMIAPEAAYDPMRAVAGQMIEAEAQKAGLNVKSVPMSFGSHIALLRARDFDLIVTGWRIGTDPGGYLRSFFHCSEEKNGSNYAGYCDPGFDALIDEFDAASASSWRVRLIRDAQALLRRDLPYDVLYFPDSLYAFRKDFLTLAEVQGSPWDAYWTFLLARVKAMPATLGIELAGELVAGESVRLTVRLTSEGVGVAGARLDLSASAMLGIEPATVVTDPAGEAQATVRVSPESTDHLATIRVTSSADGYVDGSTTIQMQVWTRRSVPPRLAIEEMEVSPRMIHPGGQAEVRLRVTMRDGSPAAGALVSFWPVTMGELSEQWLVVAKDGTAEVTYRLPSSARPGPHLDVTIAASVFLRGDSAEQARGTVVIALEESPKACDCAPPDLRGPAIAMVGALGGFAPLLLLSGRARELMRNG